MRTLGHCFKATLSGAGLFRPAHEALQQQASCHTRAAAWGISLIEVAILLLLLSVFFIPVSQTLGNRSIGSGASQTTAGLNRDNLRLNTFADNLMQRAVMGNIPATNINSSAALQALTLPSDFNINTFPRGGSQTFGPYDYHETLAGNNVNRVRYTWVIEDVSSNTGNLVASTPRGNRLLRATLNVVPADPNSVVEPLTVSSYLHVPEPAATVNVQIPFAMVFALDRSGSMCFSERGGAELTAWIPRNNNQNIRTTRTNNANKRLCSPYSNSRFGRDLTTLPSGIVPADLNMFDDRNLDITWSYPADSTETPFNDRFLSPGELGVPSDADCGLAANTPLFSWLFSHEAITLTPLIQSVFTDYCQDAAGLTQAEWQTQIQPNISRTEALRSALLNFLITIESEPTLVQGSQMGMVFFESRGEVVVPLETAQPRLDPATGNDVERFVANREAAIWINRLDPEDSSNSNWGRAILVGGGTNYYDAITMSAESFDGMDPNIDNRYIILMSDGQPNGGQIETTPGLINQAELMSNTYGVRYFTIGFSGIEDEGRTLQQGIASATGGEYYEATSAEELDRVFLSILFQIRRRQILSQVKLYNEALYNVL